MTIVLSPQGTNSSRDYTWLQNTVALWLHRSDLGAVLPDFVMLAEKRINADLRARNQGGSTTLIASTTSNAIALPSDCAEITSLSIPGFGDMDYMAPARFAEQNAITQPGCPRTYTLIGTTVLLAPTPDIAYAVNLAYLAQVPSLADTAGSNWLIFSHPEIYLSATMCEALAYTKDEAARQVWEQKYATAMDGLNKRDWSTAGQLFVRPDSNTP